MASCLRIRHLTARHIPRNPDATCARNQAGRRGFTSPVPQGINGCRKIGTLIVDIRQDQRQLKAIDLFSGAGGLTLGLQSLGAAELLKAVQLRRGQLDLLAGCPPCQGFSTLRTRKKQLAVRDDRNDLLFEFLRMVEALAPRAIMLENVPSLARDYRIRTFVKHISRLGYRINCRRVKVVDAAQYGVPQRRQRMILLASKLGQVGEAEPSEPVTVRQCLAGAALCPVGESGDPLHDHKSNHTARVREIIRHIPKDGGSRSALPQHLVLPCHRRMMSGFRDVYGRMAWDRVAPTITGGCGNPSKGRYLHPEEDRAISLREAALLQTFPADYHFDLSKGRDKVALMIGNALPPEFIRRHAVALAKTLASEG